MDLFALAFAGQPQPPKVRKPGMKFFSYCLFLARFDLQWCHPSECGWIGKLPEELLNQKVLSDSDCVLLIRAVTEEVGTSERIERLIHSFSLCGYWVSFQKWSPSHSKHLKVLTLINHHTAHGYIHSFRSYQCKKILCFQPVPLLTKVWMLICSSQIWCVYVWRAQKHKHKQS